MVSFTSPSSCSSTYHSSEHLLFLFSLLGSWAKLEWAIYSKGIHRHRRMKEKIKTGHFHVMFGLRCPQWTVRDRKQLDKFMAEAADKLESHYVWVKYAKAMYRNKFKWNVLEDADQCVYIYGLYAFSRDLADLPYLC
jgi:hypothetical protein